MKKAIAGTMIHLTRRCNMNCLHCLRGKAQNQDLTKEMADKILDELQDYYLLNMVFTGGEPMLNDKVLVYIANEIIRRKIRLNGCTIITNATVCNPDIRGALSRLADYLADARIYVSAPDTYQTDAQTTVDIICSTDEHANTDVLQKCIDYYNDAQNKYMKAYNQTKAIKEGVTNTILSGNLLDNWNKIDPKQLAVVSTPTRDFYCVSKATEEEFFIDTTIEFCTNGAVMVDCASSFAEEDDPNQWVCNIMDCDNNLHEYLLKWSWEHPVPEFIAEKRAQLEGLRWKIKNHVSLLEDDPTPETVDLLITQTDEVLKEYKRVFGMTHEQYTHLAPDECAQLTVANLVCGLPSLFQKVYQTIFSKFYDTVENPMQAQRTFKQLDADRKCGSAIQTLTEYQKTATEKYIYARVMASDTVRCYINQIEKNKAEMPYLTVEEAANFTALDMYMQPMYEDIDILRFFPLHGQHMPDTKYMGSVKELDIHRIKEMPYKQLRELQRAFVRLNHSREVRQSYLRK